MTIIRRRQPVAPEPVATIEYGILANQLTMAIYPDLVFDTNTDPTLIEARIADLAAIYPGLECSLMYRARGDNTWREVGTGRTPRQVLADRWRIRVDGGA